MSLHSETAAPMALGDGGSVDEKAVAAFHYLTPHFNATDLAAAVIGARFGLSGPMARLVIQLAGVGARLS